jgi:hypothetical protein|tara:strand:- start:228 stop:407 length:180 start_codon:yes stop_codon:yes gene_type:complete
MSSGFDVDFDMSSDEISVLMKKYKKIKKYQKSNLFTIKTINGTENYVSKMIEEAKEEGF